MFLRHAGKQQLQEFLLISIFNRRKCFTFLEDEVIFQNTKSPIALNLRFWKEVFFFNAVTYNYNLNFKILLVLK